MDTSKYVQTCSKRIIIVHIAEQTEKNPGYTFSSKQLAEELNVKQDNIINLIKGLKQQHSYIKVVREERIHNANRNIYQITNAGIKYADYIKKQEGLL